MKEDVISLTGLAAFVMVVIFLFAMDDAEAACRSSAVKHKFDISQGYPHGRKGYIVDHVCALANGGIDSPSNMQYQTPTESRAKDRIENTKRGRVLYCNEKNSTPIRQVFNCK